jgi:hypothetical protein
MTEGKSDHSDTVVADYPAEGSAAPKHLATWGVVALAFFLPSPSVLVTLASAGEGPLRPMVQPQTRVLATAASRFLPGAQMAANSQRRRLSGKARWAPELLVDQQGNTEAYLGAYIGFTDQMLSFWPRPG